MREKEASLVMMEDELEERKEREGSEKGEGARVEERSKMGWWARVRRALPVGDGAETRDLEPGAR